MSRSRKKNPVFKQLCKYYKQLSNRMFRKRPLELTNISHKKYKVDQWEICDQSFHMFNDNIDECEYKKLVLRK